jgi:hypothetical protein
MIHPDQPTGTASLLRDNGIGVTDEWTAIRSMVSQPVVLNGPQSLVADAGREFFKNNTDPNQGPRPGIYIRAVFRPLITNYKVGNSTDDLYPFSDQVTFPFDYIDLRLNPMSRIIPASNALYGVANTGFGFGIAAQGAAEQIDSWLQITIRRVMCPNIPIQTIAVLRNRINGPRGYTTDTIPIPIGYTPACFTVPGLNLPIPQLVVNPANIVEWNISGLLPTVQTFPSQTLRFDDAVWEKKVIQSCIDQNASTVDHIVILKDPNGVPLTRPMTWWNGELTFSWRTVLDNWYPTTYRPNDSHFAPNAASNPPDYVGRRKANYGWVTWNCDWLPAGMGIDISKIQLPTTIWQAITQSGLLVQLYKAIQRYSSGWYELASWQGMSIHGDLDEYDISHLAFGLFPNLGVLYLQRKYWDDNDVRLRGGNASNWIKNNLPNPSAWGTPGFPGDGDMLKLLGRLPNATPFDLLFRIDAP